MPQNVNPLGGECHEVRESDILNGLIGILNGNFSNNKEYLYRTVSFRKDVSSYKKCEFNAGANIPFDDAIKIKELITKNMEHNNICLKNMTSFVETYIEPTKREWLIKAIIEAINLDSSILASTKFFTDIKKETKKEHLDKVLQVNIEVFLLSVFSFILKERPDNTMGRDTFLKWCEKKVGVGWKLKTNMLGNLIQHTIHVLRYTDNETTNENLMTDADFSNQYDEHTGGFTESRPNIEIVNTPPSITYVQNQNIQQIGKNNIVVNSPVGLTINLGDDDE